MFGSATEILTGIGSGVTNYTMPSVNNAWCGRFTAHDSRDVKSVYFRWNTVTAASTVDLRIETIDATTGKPTGTLYDANATKSFTPSTASAFQQVTFDTLPTTGLTAGVEYGVLLITTGAGTAHTLRSHVPSVNLASAFPAIVLTAADGSTRSNFAEVVGSIPSISIVFEDDVEEATQFTPTSVANTDNCFGTNYGASRFVLDASMVVAGASIGITRAGTPAGDLRVQILDSDSNLVTGCSQTIDKDSLLNVTQRNIKIFFDTPVTLPPGTYRLAVDSSGSANSSNCFRTMYSSWRTAALCPAYFYRSTSSNGTSWTDQPTDQVFMTLILGDQVVKLLVHPGMGGGMRS